MSTLVLVLSFQNCGKLAASKVGSASASSHSNPHIMRVSSVEALNTDISFRVHDESLPTSVQFNWSFTINGTTTGCAPKTGSNASTFVLNCTSAGTLKVMVSVDNAGEILNLNYSTNLQAPANGNEIPMEIVFEIPPGTNASPWNTAATRVETFVGQRLRLRNMDSNEHQLHTNGRPCPHGNLIPPGGMADCVISQSYSRAANGAIYDHNEGTAAEFHLVAYDGAALYQTNCAGCHGALASSVVRNAKVSQILSARTRAPAMVGNAAVQALTRRQIEAISYALGGR